MKFKEIPLWMLQPRQFVLLVAALLWTGIFLVGLRVMATEVDPTGLAVGFFVGMVWMFGMVSIAERAVDPEVGQE